MVLVDEAWLTGKEPWQKPLDIKTKSGLDQQMKSELGNDMISDDVKVTQYSHDLARFLNTRNKLADNIDQPTPQLLRGSPKVESPKRRRQRAPKKFEWVDWK